MNEELSRFSKDVLEIADLIFKFRKNEISAEEQLLLGEWRRKSEENERLFEELIDDEKLLVGLIDYAASSEYKEANRERVLNEIEAPKRVMWYKWVAAASIAIIVGLAVLFNYNKGRSKKDTIVDSVKNVPIDVPPGSYRAKLTLSDGSVVVLDSAVGDLGKQGNVAVKNENGQLVYREQGKNVETLYNTLSTSTGESYSTLLADGSKLWLNSLSTVRFPVAFDGKGRVIEASGEIFLEVAHDAKRPFRVVVLQNGGKRCDVEVLGTSFNIMAHPDQPLVEATLIHGKISLSTGSENKPLLPGQQAILNKEGNVRLLDNVDTERITAWKDQTFYFDNDNLKSVMRQISQWYGIEVEYIGDMPDKQFSGLVSRNKNLSEVMKVIEYYGLKYKIEGKKVILEFE